MCHGSVTYCARIMEIERRETEAFNHRKTTRMIVMPSHFSHLKTEFPLWIEVEAQPRSDPLLASGIASRGDCSTPSSSVPPSPSKQFDVELVPLFAFVPQIRPSIKPV